MESRTVLFAGVPPQTEARLRASFPDLDFLSVPAGGAGRKALHDATVAVALVSVAEDPEGAFRLVHELVARDARVLVLGPAKDADLILRAMREGAKEFVVSSDDAAVDRALREQVTPLRASGGGQVYALFPAKGGVGATTLATNLAGALQRSGERTCLVDLNLNMGDVLAFLDLPGGYSIADVIANMRRLDRELLDASLLSHASGVRVLAQSHRVEEADRVDAGAVSSVLAFLRSHYGAVVVDGLRSFDDLSVAAVDAADQILLLVTQEVPAVRDARRCMDLLRRLGAEHKVKVVVNRFREGPEINADVVADTVGVSVTATVANDYPAVLRAVNRGELLQDAAPRAQVTRDVEKVAGVLGRGPQAKAAAQPEKRSLLQRFFAPKVSHATE